MIPVNIDLWEEAEGLVPTQFYKKQNFNELLKQYIEELQISNDTFFDTLNNLNVNLATGYLLDCVGSYVAVPRNADDDEAYRERIKRRVLIGSSEGTPNDLLRLLELSTQADTVRIWEHFPVSTTMSTNGTLIPSRLPEYMQEASPTSSGNIVIYLNPFNNCFIPSEIGFDVLKLASRELNPFIANAIGTTLTDPFIVVNNLIFGGDSTAFAELSEFTYGVPNGTEAGVKDYKGILCEISFTNGGVFDYNNDYVELSNTITYWWMQMNFSTPLDFGVY